MPRNERNRTMIRVLAAAACLGLAPFVALAGPGDDVVAQKPFTVHWAVRNQPQFQERTGIDWASRIDLQGAPIEKDCVFMYWYAAGKYPHAGLQVMKMDPNWMRDHYIKLERDINKFIPDPNYSGFAIIDYERLHPIWDVMQNIPSDLPYDASDKDFKDDWRDYLRSVTPGFNGMSPAAQEALLEAEWNETAKEFWLGTIRKAKELRPKAKWTYYGRPSSPWKAAATPNVVGYGDYTGPLSRAHDELGWLWEASDVILLDMFTRRVAVDEGVKPRAWRNEVSHQTQWNWHLNCLGEAKRLGDRYGKPVYACIWNRYETGRNQPSWHQPCNEANMLMQMRAPIAAGADGVILWESIHSEEVFNELQRVLDDTIIPETRRIAEMPGNSGGAQAAITARLPNGKAVTLKATKPASSKKPGAPAKSRKVTDANPKTNK